jgi:homoserine O-acetyltransferase
MKPAVIVAALVLLVLGGCGVPDDTASEDTASHTRAPDSRGLLLDPTHPEWSTPAPDTVRIRFETTQGDFVVRVIRAWAPRAADRFFNLVRHGYYDDARFHRTVPGFIVQWGLAGDPEVTAAWLHRTIPDDPGVVSNTRGRIAFAFTDAGTRSTQVFIATVDLQRLDAGGFAPFGEVIEGMDVVDALYSGYGEGSGGGVRAGGQDSLILGGNAYLDREFPLLDRILRAYPEG